jgi:glycerate kinase
MISKEAAYIEMAQASGLDLLEVKERNCLFTSSYGTGQLIRDASQRGIRKVFLFVGGSATNDGGIGVLDALGIHPLGTQGRLSSVGKSLWQITGFEESLQKVHGLDFTVICDVLNPLYGPDGAAYVYGPQKGADKESVVLLDRGLQNLAKVVWESRKIRIDDFEGAGAAGGIAAGLKAYFDIRIQSGFDAISEMTGLSDILSASDLVITGEGKFDGQTLQGKVVKGVYDLCQRTGRQLAVICGVLELDPEMVSSLDIWKISPLVGKDTTMDQAQNNAYELVSQRAYELFQEKS